MNKLLCLKEVPFHSIRPNLVPQPPSLVSFRLFVTNCHCSKVNSNDLELVLSVIKATCKKLKSSYGNRVRLMDFVPQNIFRPTSGNRFGFGLVVNKKGVSIIVFKIWLFLTLNNALLSRTMDAKGDSRSPAL